MAETIDTLQIAEDLEASGLNRGQAKAIAHAVRQGRGDLATKADLAELKADLKADLTMRVVAIAGLTVAAVKLLPNAPWG